MHRQLQMSSRSYQQEGLITNINWKNTFDSGSITNFKFIGDIK